MREYTLKSCPFCGGKAEERDIEKPFLNGWVGCPKCHCFINWIKNGKEQAVNAWNSRAEKTVVYDSEWTPIKSGKLPEEGEHVLLTVDDVPFVAAGLQVCEAWLKRGIWQTATKCGVFRIVYPLAWKPKPTKYEEV